MRLGVVGTMVWDTIHARAGADAPPVEDWGGISYALAAADAALPKGWTIFPIIRAGADMRGQIDRYLGSLDRVDSLEGVQTVSEANNRVELFYHTAGRRCEKLTGGIPAWPAAEILRLASSCDALYVNFVAGWELDLAAAVGLRDAVEGPVYCDLHSLMLGVGDDGMRRLRPLERWREWLAAFDIVQLNEDELIALADGRDDPWTIATEAVGQGGTDAFLVTLGDRGAEWVSVPEFAPLRPGVRPTRDGTRTREDQGALVRGSVEAAEMITDPDPTGCGDVWGASCFSGLLAGEPLESAVRLAGDAAARNAAHRGASGLNAYLRSSTGSVTGGGSL